MRIFSLLALSISILFISCKKDGNSANLLNSADTLTTGWSKKVVASGVNFSDIVFSNSSIGYVGGAKIYKTIDSGKTWNPLSSFSGQAINLAITNDNKFFGIIGNSIYASINNGLTFNSTVTKSAVKDIFFIDNNNGFCVGPGFITKTTDGGSTWQEITPLSGLRNTSDRYATASFLSTSSGIITIGDSIYKSVNNLNTWMPIKITSLTGGNPGSAVSIFSLSPTIIYAGAWNGKIFQSLNGGTSFELKFSLPNFSTNSSSYLDLHFIDANVGYACYGNRIYKTTDGGSNWNPVVSLGNSKIIEIHFTDAKNGWGCTDKGEVLRYSL